MARGQHQGGPILQSDATLSQRAIQQAIESELTFSVSYTMADELASEWTSILVKGWSICCIPLHKHRLMESCFIWIARLGRHLSGVDHQLLETIATEAAALLHNGCWPRRNLSRGLMTVALPTLPFASIEARSVPCLRIGRDFFDALALDDCVCVTVADVSGKASPAATLQGIIHAQLMAGQDLASIATLMSCFSAPAMWASTRSSCF